MQKKGGNTGKGGGQTLNGFNRRTGGRNWLLTRNRGNHIAPKRSLQAGPGKGSTLSPPVWSKPMRPPRSFPMESPVSVNDEGPSVKRRGGSNCVQSFATTLDLGRESLREGEDTAVVLGTGAATNPACLEWLGNHNLLLARNRGSRGYRLIRQVHGLNLAVGAMVRRALQRIL